MQNKDDINFRVSLHQEDFCLPFFFFFLKATFLTIILLGQIR